MHMHAYLVSSITTTVRSLHVHVCASGASFMPLLQQHVGPRCIIWLVRAAELSVCAVAAVRLQLGADHAQAWPRHLMGLGLGGARFMRAAHGKRHKRRLDSCRHALLTAAALTLAAGGAQGGVFTHAGVAQTFTGLGAGDAGYVPRGSAHWLRNTSPHDTFVVLIFNDGVLTTEDIGGLVGTLPADVVASSLNVTQAFVAGMNPRLAAMVPAVSGGNATRAGTASAGRR